MLHFKEKIPALKSVSSDILLNLLATFVSTGVMQLVLYPQLALHMSDDSYGEMLTAMGFVNILILSFGNSLCNARIVVNKEYQKAGIVGDFQIILLLSVIICIILVTASDFFFKWPLPIFIGIIFVAVLSVLKSYYFVTYRITLNYKQNLYANIVMAVVYVLGSFILIKFVSWPFLFAFPCLIGLFYVGLSSDILKEPFVKTDRYKATTKVVYMLVLSGIIGNITQYLDRFIVLPLLGGSSVSYYTVAAFFSKSLSMVLLPMTGVLLTYFASDQILINKRRFDLINFGLLIVSALFLIITVTLGGFVTKLLYPTLINSSSQYILLASIGVIIGIADSFNGIVVLAKAPSYWQVVLSSTKTLIYFVSCIILVKQMGLFGLCWGIILTNFLGFTANYAVGTFYLKNANKRKE